MNRSRVLATFAIGLSLLGSGIARADDPVTEVTQLNATVGSAIAVSGKATFAPGLKAKVAEDAADDHALTAIPADSGTDLLSASITAVSPKALDFELEIGDLPEGGMDEIINYNWPLTIGTSTIELNAHSAATGAELTCGVIFLCDGGNVGQPRFAVNVCAINPDTGQNTCAVTAVPGEITANSLIWHVNTSQASGLSGGDVELETGQVAASLSASGVTWYTNGNLGDLMAGESLFAFPAPNVSFGIAPAGTNVDAVALTSTVKANATSGNFSGSLSKPAAGSYILVAQACFGEDNCSARNSTPVTVA
jgi:hypothetical protein